MSIQTSHWWFESNSRIILYIIKHLGDFESLFMNFRFPVSTVFCYFVEVRFIRRVWRYQRGNQTSYIEEEQTTQWPKENKYKRTNNDLQNISIKLKIEYYDSTKNWGDTRCSGRVSSSSSKRKSVCMYRQVGCDVVKNYIILHITHLFCAVYPDARHFSRFSYCWRCTGARRDQPPAPITA